jgi:hypothetical protein
VVEETSLSLKITGWSEGHPALTRIVDYPFGCAKPQCPDPTSEESRRKKDGYSASFNELYRSYVRRAKTGGRKFNISEKDFWQLTSQPCIVCAKRPLQTGRKGRKNPYLYNGLDRRNSNGDYVLGNVVSCCGEHNRIKSDLTYEDFFKHCLTVVLSELSKTATANNDIETLERLIDLFPNVRFLLEHHASVWQVLATNTGAMPFTPEMALPRERRGVRRYPDRPIPPKVSVVEPKVKRAAK